jgi:nitrogen-specific signal transduction histidine kinase
MCPPSNIYSYSLRQTIFSILRTLTVPSGTNLDLTYEVAPDVPDILIGNSSYLRQVIFGLVNNAIKSTPSVDAQIRGHVSLSTRLIASDDENVVLEFCVMDTGLGVTKDFLDLFLDTKVMFVCFSPDGLSSVRVVGILSANLPALCDGIATRSNVGRE